MQVILNSGLPDVALVFNTDIDPTLLEALFTSNKVTKVRVSTSLSQAHVEKMKNHRFNYVSIYQDIRMNVVDGKSVNKIYDQVVSHPDIIGFDGRPESEFGVTFIFSAQWKK